MSTNQDHVDCFEIVWQAIAERYFDPTFGGLDWNEIYHCNRPMVDAVGGDDEFYRLLNQMLFELNVSHVGVVPPDQLDQIAPGLAAKGSVGIDIRLIESEAVVLSVEPASPAAQVGLRVGFVLQSIDGKTVEDVTGGIEPAPPLHDRNMRRRVTDAVRQQILGSPDTTVSIVYLDEQGTPHSESLVRARRGGGVVFDDSLPQFFIEFDAKRLDADIGFIQFNAFVPPVDQRFLETIDSMGDTSGLIIDLRGNQGGLFPVRKALAEKLVGERTLFWSYARRDGIEDVYLTPARSVYNGIVVVLIAVTWVSSAEEFSGGLQAIGRAVVVGERSPGIVLIAEIMQLPNGATFLYPNGGTTTANGSVLEGNGVTPDIEVGLDRRLLLQGIDSQTEAAKNYIKNELQID